MRYVGKCANGAQTTVKPFTNGERKYPRCIYLNIPGYKVQQDITNTYNLYQRRKQQIDLKRKEGNVTTLPTLLAKKVNQYHTYVGVATICFNKLKFL